ncbi:MAG: thioredoxin family protein [Hyphomonadaceae bacterium]|jgi:thiol:disulfide interchange protein DsbD|nr:thioredoxin family protein [Hyphomonadaceae bacterium]
MQDRLSSQFQIVLAAFLALVLAVTSVDGASARQASAVIGPKAQSENVTLTLLGSVAAAAPGQTISLGIRQEIAPGWHTYWRNPGDSGDATRVIWTLPDGVTAGPVQWPRPEAQPFATLLNYGYSGTIILPVDLTIPAEAAPGSIIRVQAAVSWLECADICIPADGTVAVLVPVAAASVPGDDAAAITAAKTLVPQPLSAQGVITDAGTSWTVSLPVAAFAGVSRAQFFPHELENGALISYTAPQTVQAGEGGLSLTVAKSGSAPATLSGPVSGVIVTGEGATAEAFEVSFVAGPVPAGVTGRAVGIVDPMNGSADAAAGSPVMPVWQAIALAFLGGLILNLMPCVFPILAMKSIGLMQAAHGDRREARQQGLLYGAGVMVTFLALAGLLVGLRASGEALGWGFQLQQPLVLAGIIALLVVVTLNLVGVFEVAGGFQNTGQDLTRRSGHAGSFFTGVLAVVVASPCTAPFMGAALGFALTQSAPVALAVFAGLGAGFAAPFMAITFIPGLMARLPRPGPWMVRFKQVLALPVLATAAWLAWVMGNQLGMAGWENAAWAALGGALFAFAWNGRIVGWRRPAILGLSALVLGSTALALVAEADAPATATLASGLPDGAEAWTPAREAELRAQGKTVFVNFTADWCVSCKVNEAGVFADPAVMAALRADGAAWLIADWTRRDDAITRALSSHGRSGVPLYLVWQPARADPVVLPQLPGRAAILAAMD